MTDLQKEMSNAIISLMKAGDGTINFMHIDQHKIKLKEPVDPSLFANQLTIVRKILTDRGLIAQQGTNLPLRCMLTEPGWDFESFEVAAAEKTQTKMKEWYETENARLIFEDYPRVRNQAHAAKFTSIISAIAAVIAAIIAFVALRG